MNLAIIDYIIIIFYLLGILFLGVYFRRYVHTSQGYFLAGRMLPFWAIAFSIVGSDIGVTDFIGLSGEAYKHGIVAANYDWIGSVPAMVLAGLVFIPYYWRNGVYTIPEYLGLRYNIYVRSFSAIIWLIVISLNIGIMFWIAGGIISGLLGWPLALSIMLMAIIVGVYTIFGGLSAVVMTDVVQVIIMMIGSSAILILGFIELGGWNNMVSIIQSRGAEYEHHFNLVLPMDTNSPYPWTGILFGLTLVLAPAYYIGNQNIVQRCLGASDEWNAKAGMLGGAFLKTLVPLFIVFPGIIALALYPGLPDSDRTLLHLVEHLLPPGITGLVLAAFIAALMSSIDSFLASTSTIFTKDLYQTFIRKHAIDSHYLKVGRWTTAVILIIGMISAPLTDYFSGVYTYFQTLNSFIQGPLLAILLLGIFWKRTSRPAGIFGLLGGVSLALLMFIYSEYLFSLNDPYLYIAWWSFCGAFVITILVTLVTKPPDVRSMRGLIFGLSQNDDELQKIISDKLGKSDV